MDFAVFLWAFSALAFLLLAWMHVRYPGRERPQEWLHGRVGQRTEFKVPAMQRVTLPQVLAAVILALVPLVNVIAVVFMLWFMNHYTSGPTLHQVKQWFTRNKEEKA